MKKKTALIFGITGQDGSYLSRLLLEKNYVIIGVKRKSSSFNTDRIDDLFTNYENRNKFKLIYGDLTDAMSISSIIEDVKPDEIYNLGAQSHVKVSFEMPEYTTNVDALGTLRILEAIKKINKIKKIKFYQAGTSEMFGSSKPPQDENTLFQPQSPYAVAKLYAHWITKNYRDSYKIFASNGILFNHESPQRGGTFVTKKVISFFCRFLKNKNQKLFLGNIYAKRDWGHAKDYVVAMWKILQQKKSDDYVIATGKHYTVKEFINKVCKKLKIKLIWKGKGLNEVGFIEGKKIIFISKKYFRPLEVESLKGNSNYARKKLNWKPKYNLDSLIDDMINSEINGK
ncbi:GDP-mannose 4,6-dehydratase [Candidatus Pelagibacter ubique]|nr:GDP-mannose 4,6-dehydratase [Candidatus Pelagibacter ubique]